MTTAQNPTASPTAQNAALGNLTAEDGRDRCWCGCKYWEGDRCVDCQTHVLRIPAHERRDTEPERITTEMPTTRNVTIKVAASGPFPPPLALGTVISGAEVVAAVRQEDRDGMMPGLHIVTAHDRRSAQFVTWLVAWQADVAPERPADARAEDTGPGRWVTNAGHYFPVPMPDTSRDATIDVEVAVRTATAATRRKALADMMARY